MKVADLPSRRKLVWVKRIFGALQCIVYAIIGYKQAWWAFTAVVLVSVCHHLELSAKHDIARIDEADFTEHE
jgi:hypothetical protein